MNSMIITKTYDEPKFCEKEILRYSGCKNADGEILNLLKSCLCEVKDKLTYRVCYRELPVTATEDVCDFGVFTVRSKNLTDNLASCKTVILFGATVGVEIDRLIARYGRISPSKALMFQAIGAERIEALCDVFCEDVKREHNLHTRPRFSPGYGDLPLSAQKDIFAMLDCSKRIGLTLNDSLLMSPSKSVTAFVGLSEDEIKEKENKCSLCDKKDCSYRGAV